MMHASNVCGTLLPLKEVGAFCKAHGLKFIVDCAQTAGVFPISMKEMNIDALCFTGHKGLYGPQGIGGFILQENMIGKISPLLSGGTGSISHTEEIPDFMPDRFEPGTMNLPGIFGLHAALEWLNDTGIESIHNKEKKLTELFLKKIQEMDLNGEKIRLIGKESVDGRTSVVSIQTPGRDVSEIAYLLDKNYGIMTRVGLHCAPNAHKTLDTYPTGTVRFSFGYFNTEEEVLWAVKALEEILWN
jgi:selenocysteine lyase/cysteine desulfurase